MKLSPTTLKSLAAAGVVGAVVIAEWPEPTDEDLTSSAQLYQPTLWERTTEGFYRGRYWVLEKLGAVPPRGRCGFCGMG